MRNCLNDWLSVFLYNTYNSMYHEFTYILCTLFRLLAYYRSYMLFSELCLKEIYIRNTYRTPSLVRVSKGAKQETFIVPLLSYVSQKGLQEKHVSYTWSRTCLKSSYTRTTCRVPGLELV